jgi:RNA polymerase sigma-70 factor (ECF subfamily)
MAEAILDMADCLQRVRQKDEEAARLLLNHLYPLVIKIVRAHLPRRTSEEDLAQAIFMKVFAKIEQFSGKVPFEHWVSRVAVNTCLNQLQSEKVRPELRWADLSEDEERVIEALSSTGEELHPSKGLAARELTDRLLASLNPEDRLVISMIHLEERSVEEVRQMTGWSRSLIKVRAFRARQKLKKQFKDLIMQEQL